MSDIKNKYKGREEQIKACCTHVCNLRNVYILLFLTSPIAPHTSYRKTSGKAKSPRTESRASAKSSGFFLSFPASTMVVAGVKKEQVISYGVCS